MDLNTTDILISYKKNPIDYIVNLPDTNNSVDILIYLITEYKNDSELALILKEYGIFTPRIILNSKHSVENIIQLLSLIYLESEYGDTGIAEYYANDYQKYKTENDFDLAAHVFLLTKLINRMLTNEYHMNVAFQDEFFALENVLNDISTNVNDLTISTLVNLMPVYSIIQQEKVYFDYHTEANKNTLSSINNGFNIIAHHLYGSRFEALLQIANTLELTANVDYWRACLDGKEVTYSEEDRLPML